MSRCCDCGLTPRDQHAVLLTQTVTIGKRVITWVVCGRCWLQRGDERRGERGA